MTGLAIAVVVVWALAGGVLVGTGSRLVGAQVLAGALVGAVAVWGAHGSGAAGSFAAALVPAIVAAIALGLPDGRLAGGRLAFAAALGVLGMAGGLVYVAADRVPSGLEVAAASAIAVVVVAPGVRRRSRAARVADRARLQLLAASVIAAAAVALAAGFVALGTDSDLAQGVLLAACALPALALAAGCGAPARRAAPTVVSVAVTALSVAVVASLAQAFALLAAGRVPQDDQRRFVAPSFLAAALAALAYSPVRARSFEATSRWVFGARRRPEDAGRTLTARASEGAPLDDLLPQLATSLRGAMSARAVEVWTRRGDTLERVASSPDRGVDRLDCTSAELTSLARASVVGDAWVQLWLPRLERGRHDAQTRVAPAVHTGSVLGLLIVERSRDDVAFTEADDRSLGAVGGRLAEVLNARRLDAELTATLDDLRASRSRLVAAADAERRRIERNLHDGAQQHLVALAVSLRLARDLARDDPDAGAELLDQLGEDVRDTIQQLRDLAHGIYPPLLADSGLAEALRAAVQRSPLAVRVDATRQRFSAEVEAAVYFCCLEALQNASKHAPDAEVDIRVWEDDGLLRFEISDDGPGFDPRETSSGHGFQNMADRLGAIGGRVSWQSAPGAGTRVSGEVVA